MTAPNMQWLEGTTGPRTSGLVVLWSVVGGLVVSGLGPGVSRVCFRCPDLPSSIFDLCHLPSAIHAPLSSVAAAAKEDSSSDSSFPSKSSLIKANPDKICHLSPMIPMIPIRSYQTKPGKVWPLKNETACSRHANAQLPRRQETVGTDEVTISEIIEEAS